MFTEHAYNLKKTTQASQGGVFPMSCVDSPEGPFRMHFLWTQGA